MNRTFVPARQPKTVLPFMAAFLFFPVMGIFMTAFGAPVAGVIVIVLGVLAETYLVAVAWGAGYGYTVTDEHAVLAGPFITRTLPLTKIASVTFLTPEETTAFLRERFHPVVEASAGADLTGWLRSSVRYGDLVRFASVPLVMSETEAGGPLAVTGFGVHGAGDAVLLVTSEGEFLLATPADADGFKRALLDDGVPNATVAELPEQDPDALAAQTVAAARIRKIILVSLVSVAALTAVTGVITLVVDLNPAPSALELRSDVPPAYAAAGYWETDSRFIFVSALPDTANIPASGALIESMYEEALGAMVQVFTNAHGGSAAAFLKSMEALTLSGTLQSTGQTRFVRALRREGHPPRAIYRIEGTYIRSVTDQALKRFFKQYGD